jgi:hypothetical protein
MFSATIRWGLMAVVVGLSPMLVSAKEVSTKMETRLTATAAARAASGKAKFESVGARSKFSTEGQGLAASMNGQSANVSVNGVSVGTARIALGRFDLNLDSSSRQVVPQIKAGDLVSVSVNGVNILNGKF